MAAKVQPTCEADLRSNKTTLNILLREEIWKSYCKQIDSTKHFKVKDKCWLIPNSIMKIFVTTSCTLHHYKQRKSKYALE